MEPSALPTGLPTPRTFGLAVDRGVATITLDRPERLNALTFESYRELAETFEDLDRHAAVRAVVITGRGRGFCSGGDQDDIIRHRFFGGAKLRYYVFAITLEGTYAAAGNSIDDRPTDAVCTTNSLTTNCDSTDQAAAQKTFTVSTGFDF